MKVQDLKVSERLVEWGAELREHPFVGLTGFTVGVLYAVGASLLDKIATHSESAVLGADLLKNVPAFLFAVFGGAVLLWIIVQIAARKQRGIAFVLSLCLGTVAGFLVLAIARALAV